MPHIDWQEVIALGIVAVAFWAVGRRLWSQIAAFRNRPVRRRPASASKSAPTPSAPPLIQLQLKPPAHLKRPPSEH